MEIAKSIPVTNMMNFFFFFICTTVRLTAPNLSVFNKQKLSYIKPVYYLFILYLSKPATKCNSGTIKLDRDFSTVIALVLLTFKLNYPIHRLFEAQKGMLPMARPCVILSHKLF